MTRGGVLVGLDTGGTFTDAVAIDAERRDLGPVSLLASAKRLTTPEDLSLGIGAALAATLEAAEIEPHAVSLVAMSTTLATNALVEGQGGRAGLVMIGFAPADLERHGLAEALGDAPLIAIGGGHDAGGHPRAALDMAALAEGIADAVAVGTEAFAVCGLFAVRNPAHERAVAAAIKDQTGCPVTCSHDLSARIGGPRRALTALFNARLTPLIDRLIRDTRERIAELGISAPLMVVRGDGALVSADFAADRPVETILSGPAASLVGAGWLSGLKDALVADIGGTTTDIALLRGGRPRLDPDGAKVGTHRTLVEAVAMATHGLGGDSAVSLGPQGEIVLGPRRAVPLALLADRHPARIRTTLAQQAQALRPHESHARFVVATRGAAGLPAGLADGPVALDEVSAHRKTLAALKRLEAEGRVRHAGPTPSDAAHVLGLHTPWDTAAARAGLALAARQRRPDGTPIAASAEALAERILATLARRSAEAVLAAALAEDGYPDGLADSPIAAAALDGRAGVLAPRLGFRVPVIGLGASAATYYPEVGRLLGAETIVPPHAEVANAVGAVVGGVEIRCVGLVTQPKEGQFRAHLPNGPEDFEGRDAAEAALLAALETEASGAAEAAGAEIPVLTHKIRRKEATIEGVTRYLEGEITVTATGRPRLARTETEEGLA